MSSFRDVSSMLVYQVFLHGFGLNVVRCVKKRITPPVFILRALQRRFEAFFFAIPPKNAKNRPKQWFLQDFCWRAVMNLS